MSNVTEFKRKEKTEQHLSGKARCCSCKHDWMAVSPVGTDWLECPACYLMKGRYMHPALPDADNIWQCACGCDVFHITRLAAYCINCGTEQRF